MTEENSLLVTGAGGHFGRLVVENLLGRSGAGAAKLIATTRNPDRLRDLGERGAEIRFADFGAPGSLASAFRGAARLLLVSTDVIDGTGRRLAQHRAAVEAAVEAGVRHVVYLSAPAAHPTDGPSLIADHFWTEQALAASGLDWTILRDHIYTDTLLAGLPHAVATGKLFSATGSAGRNYVLRDDCARTAAAILASGAGGRRILDVTGPAPVTQAEVAALASELTGRPVEHVALSAAEFGAGLRAAGLPPALVEGLVGFDVDAAQGFHAVTTSVVRDWTGREPGSVRDFLCAHRDALRPAASAPNR